MDKLKIMMDLSYSLMVAIMKEIFEILQWMEKENLFKEMFTVIKVNGKMVHPMETE